MKWIKSIDGFYYRLISLEEAPGYSIISIKTYTDNKIHMVTTPLTDYYISHEMMTDFLNTPEDFLIYLEDPDAFIMQYYL